MPLRYVVAIFFLLSTSWYSESMYAVKKLRKRSAVKKIAMRLL